MGMTNILFFIDETESHARDNLGRQVGYIEAINSRHERHETGNSRMNKRVLECSRKCWNKNLPIIMFERWSEAAKKNACVCTD